MSVNTYKCPYCGGGLVFDPKAASFICSHCSGGFTKEELDGDIAADNSEEPEQPHEKYIPQQETKDGEADREFEEKTVYFTCPSCGAEVMTDATTAADECFYCHNPVINSGRLSGDFRPDFVVPFKIDKEAAGEKFISWTAKKWFVPKEFFTRSNIRLMHGIYFPYWFADFDMEAGITAKAVKLRVWMVGDVKYTETSNYRIIRQGKIGLRNLSKNALNKQEAFLAECVQPFDLDKTEKFNPAFLSGFKAEKRNIEKSDIEKQLENEADGYSEAMLKKSVTGYSSVSIESYQSYNIKKTWRYIFLPSWIITYKLNGDKTLYYYALNGQNGNVRGLLPLDKLKLALFSSGLSLAVFLLFWLIGGIF